MTLSEKREVIEILLCAKDCGGMVGMAGAGIGYTFCGPAVQAAYTVRNRCLAPGVTQAAAALEAAYRLIESSPTLVAEWFGGVE